MVNVRCPFFKGLCLPIGHHFNIFRPGAKMREPRRCALRTRAPYLLTADVFAAPPCGSVSDGGNVRRLFCEVLCH